MTPEVLKREVQPVVRSVVVSLADKASLWSDLNSHPQQINALSFYVGKKAKRFTFLGGKIAPNEGLNAAPLREVAEESGVTPLGVPHQSVLGEFEYRFPDEGGHLSPKAPRHVYLMYTPIIATENRPLGNGQIEQVNVLNLPQLKTLVETGEFQTIPMEGHLALNTKDTTAIFNKSEQRKQKRALNRLLSYMTHIEEHVKKRFWNQCIQGGHLCSQEEFEQIYEKMTAEMMRDGWKVGDKNRLSEKNEGALPEIVAALDTGFLGKDIMYFLPTIAKKGLNWEGLSESTEGVKSFIKFSQGLLKDYLLTHHMSESDLRIFMRDRDIHLEDKHKMKEEFNAFVRGRLRSAFSVDSAQLNEAQAQVHKFFLQISSELKVADPNLSEGLHQEYHMLNEVAHTNFGETLLAFLDITETEQVKMLPLLRYESGRQWLLFLKSIRGIKHYNEQITLVAKSKIQGAVNVFFGPVVETKKVSLGTEGRGKDNYIRMAGSDPVIIDEKPSKSFTSFLRKSFYERVQSIADFQAFNVVLEERNGGTLEEKIERVKQIKAEFIAFLKAQFPETANQIYESHMGDKTQTYLESRSNQQQVSFSGKRVGSQSDRIPRIKSQIHINGEIVEFAFYPFESITDGTFWGWREKITDDKDYVVRRMLDGSNGLPSFYNLLFPPELYPSQYQNVVNRSGHFTRGRSPVES